MAKHALRQGAVPASSLPSLLALSIASALAAPAAYAAPAASDTIVVDAAADSGTPDESQDYSVKTTTSGTKMLLVPRDIPQSVSVISQQRMQDQQLTTIEDVLENTTGVTASRIDTSRTNFFARGFYISNFAYEDMPTFLDNRWNFGDTAGDTAIYDKIEIVRGAAGLMSGTGNPSAYVNMVRKHADSQTFKGNVSATYGSWDKQRYVMDVQSPLVESGKVRGRVVAGYQDNESFVERNHYRKKFIYGVVDADITESTLLSLGYDYQKSEEDSPTWGGFPSLYSDGSRTHFRRGFNTAADWAYSDLDSTKIFANLTQRFNNGWEAKVNAMHAETNFDNRMMYIDGFPDKTTGRYNAALWQGAWGGWNVGERKQDSVDAFVRGGYELAGRQHEMMFGGSYSRQRNNYDNSYPVNDNSGLMDVGNIHDYDGNTVANPTWSSFALYQRDVIRQKSIYAATRLSLADPLHLILGARYTEWNAKYNLERKPDEIRRSKADDVTPYAGLIYDIDDTWSAYASYTSIFQPSGQRDVNSEFLDPTTGKAYEAGLKADWFNTRLTASLAVFRIEQDNVALNTGVIIPGSGGQTAYKSVDGTVSKGVELELNGALTDNWQLTFGASRYVAEAGDGVAVNPDQPRTTMKLFTRYQLPTLPALTVGGGARWQTKTWQDIAGPNGDTRISQNGYTVVDLFTRYQATKNLAVQANLNNVFDKVYYDYLGTYGVYGAPRNFSVTASYSF
ncbi:ferric-rhodotorulic acid/ferric-coprogen receptor FhuE [Cronobacter sakazakii]|uniref:Ferric-rhodotorulic acid/ferric-coprogen receptor FhuE n=11 Tax=Cronobacter sakazakii TaxID=28141 RepID=A0A7V7RFR3_CROSK|nr:ferric-rhodotorulic acid/ferric-coprogen receptor FhuE [Cronobacter sakazakii]AKE96538.1 ferric-rhodotorulic acid outer membrane transporter [Cronobacter sakazakii]AXW98009.2 ferric-rhodotorulic acid/ferric-coprogen receptor FhuE [Cronobacter sakazakii]EGT4268188.1 ferric-rhodotorulic acid/ferric-coprogen receptor FhuE [Cronobacter sakazakii]EGT4284801.1 ferric-rhodotorulic acid/ferric-coprogen receptor FhuE [Cronobacter sakazakii]EGT4293114.1 ferric-rhodotorulic acid/ferric-coprogen recept